MAARLFDARLGQRALAELCAERPAMLCVMRPLVDDPHAAKPGQDYLWAPGSLRPRLEAADPARLRAEEAAVIRRTITEQPGAVIHLAFMSWRDQLVTARMADGMVPYPEWTQVALQIDRHFPRSAPAWHHSLEQTGKLPRLAVAPPIACWRH